MKIIDLCHDVLNEIIGFYGTIDIFDLLRCVCIDFKSYIHGCNCKLRYLLLDDKDMRFF